MLNLFDRSSYNTSKCIRPGVFFFSLIFVACTWGTPPAQAQAALRLTRAFLKRELGGKDAGLLARAEDAVARVLQQVVDLQQVDRQARVEPLGRRSEPQADLFTARGVKRRSSHLPNQGRAAG